MASGDRVLIWKSEDKAGIYAIAEIIESPKIITNPPEIGYCIDTSRVSIKPCAKNSLSQQVGRKAPATRRPQA
ncbi:hypothetical protein [Nostoc sp. DedSLP04]|uniref:hypothetical protein n=1 Tax=Nostoc sp. DedSLP04 TaxID=3075401 RepID=UPI002AD44AEB|nr:hypothetical protein [Nostoc sp. DedSLP04]MDZ8031405.1 hypothetical protein [Nostoc sp. DedSLP04]